MGRRKSSDQNSRECCPKRSKLDTFAQEVRVREAVVGADQGYEEGHRVVFKRARPADYRASVHDIAKYLMDLMTNADLRRTMGEAGRKRVVENFDYRVVAKRFVSVVSERLGIS